MYVHYLSLLYFLLDMEGELFHINIKAHFRPNMSNSIRSTYMSPQLEANTRIPVRRSRRFGWG